MQRSELAELHYITAIDNLQSMAKYGVLSHERAAALPHKSVAMQSVQHRRDGKTVPGGLKLHQYANLYVNARNAMMYSRRSEDICVLRVSAKVVDFQGVVITDRNAASLPLWLPSPAGLAQLDRDIIFAKSWDHEDPRLKAEHKVRMCCEVLVPHAIHWGYVEGIYVRSATDKARVESLVPGVAVTINPRIFFGW